MGKNTAIDGADHTQNFWVGCHKVSEGCDHCYAESQCEKYSRDFTVVTRTKTWKEPYKWQREAASIGEVRKVFSCSWADFFHPHADQWRPEAWKVIRQTPNLVWRILTKRAELIADRLPEDWGNGYENVWLGVTVEMKEYLGRMDTLRKVPAAVRCVMCEPLLEELTPGIGEHLEGFHWLMVGGESGTGTMNFRSMVEQWARNLRDICLKSGVPFCFKQHAGKWTMTGTKLDGVTYHAYPEALETYKAKILRTPELDLKHWGEI